jgi:hypothetical protein
MKYIILAFTSSLLIVSMMFSVRVAAAGPFDEVCKTTSTAAVCQDAKNTQDNKASNPIYGKGSILARVTTLVALGVGIASVIMIIIGGIKFQISGGDSAGVTSARNTVFYAVIGLIVAAVAQSIVLFILNRL